MSDDKAVAASGAASGTNEPLLWALWAIVGVIGFSHFHDKFFDGRGRLSDGKEAFAGAYSGDSLNASSNASSGASNGSGIVSGSSASSGLFGKSSASGSGASTGRPGTSSSSNGSGEGDAYFNQIIHHHDDKNVAPGFAPGTHRRDISDPKLREEATSWVKAIRGEMPASRQLPATIVTPVFDEVLTSFPHLRPDKTSDWKGL